LRRPNLPTRSSASPGGESDPGRTAAAALFGHHAAGQCDHHAEPTSASGAGTGGRPRAAVEQPIGPPPTVAEVGDGDGEVSVTASGAPWKLPHPRPAVAGPSERMMAATSRDHRRFSSAWATASRAP
jgi:hypothetical protein